MLMMLFRNGLGLTTPVEKCSTRNTNRFQQFGGILKHRLKLVNLFYVTDVVIHFCFVVDPCYPKEQLRWEV